MRNTLGVAILGAGVLAAGVAAAVRVQTEKSAPVAVVTPATTPLPSHRPAPSPRPKPAVHGPAYLIGQVAFLRDPHNGAALAIRAFGASTSTTSLSSSYGYSPANGYYVTIQVTVGNLGHAPVLINPLDYELVTASGQVATVQTGNAPYSGASTALDSTELPPGQSVSGPLTFDVSTTHGRLVYQPGGHVECYWTF